MLFDEKLELGNEIILKTIDGKLVQGNFVKIEEGYLSAVINLGIVMTIPIVAIAALLKI